MVKKTIILKFLVLFSVVVATAQNPANDSVEIVSALESWPSFNHDRKQNKLITFINDNLAQIDTLEKIEVVYVQFLVDTLGFTHHHQVLRGVNQQLDAEALRVCRLIKFDNPAKQRGKPVCIYYTVPVKFSPPCSPKKRWQCRRNKH
jgi:hypothetical protein